MTLLDRIRAPRPNGGTIDPSTLPMSSPWATSDLQKILWDDIFGTVLPPNTRAAAMELSPISRSRNLLVSTICRLPLAAYSRDVRLDPQPSWISRTDTAQSPQHRMAWTVDDLIFYGQSCWWREKGADTFPSHAQRLNQDEWEVDDDNRVRVNGTPVSSEQVIMFTGLHEGILTYAKKDLRDAHRLYEIVADRLQNPAPVIDLHQTEGADLNETERDELLAVWRRARRAEGGAAVGYTNKAIEAKVLGDSLGENLLIEARNASALDLARHVGVAAGRIDATAPKASLNYETTTGRNQEFVDFDLALYMTPITARLSLDDCVPRGQRIAFELGDFTGPTPSAAGPTLED